MKVIFTVDVDTDAAWHCKGKACAVTKGKDEALFEASEKGLWLLKDLLDGCGWPATFFFEARAAEAISMMPSAFDKHEVSCHGLAHEDFIGELTEVKMTRDEKLKTLKQAKKKIDDLFPHQRVLGFRAPYLHYDDELLGLLNEAGFLYDSSVTVEREQEFETPLPELPLLEFEVDGHKRSSYLWRLLEGDYDVEDYLKFVEKALEENVVTVLATHSWHVARGVDAEWSDGQAKHAVEKVRRVLEFAERKGAEFTTCEEFLGL
ncbi:MAG: polysaccharide deacetylase family protein [Candidatus Micrarchaeota archaeon]